MISLDANVLVRHTIRDDPDQARRADALINSLSRDNPGFVTDIVLAELWWVLTRSYHKTARQVAGLIDRLLDIEAIHTQDPDLVTDALQAVVTQQADFADALIVAVSLAHGCDQTRTFDAKATNRAGMVGVD